MTQKEKADRFDGLMMALEWICDDLLREAADIEAGIPSDQQLARIEAFEYGRAKTMKKIAHQIRGMIV